MKEDIDFNRMEYCLFFLVLKGPFQTVMIYISLSYDIFFWTGLLE